MRIAAIQSLHQMENRDLHYSTISSLSKKDALRLRALLMKTIQDYVKIVQPSKEEAIYNLNIDFYELLKGV